MQNLAKWTIGGLVNLVTASATTFMRDVVTGSDGLPPVEEVNQDGSFYLDSRKARERELLQRMEELEDEIGSELYICNSDCSECASENFNSENSRPVSRTHHVHKSKGSRVVVQEESKSSDKA